MEDRRRLAHGLWSKVLGLMFESASQVKRLTLLNASFKLLLLQLSLAATWTYVFIVNLPVCMYVFPRVEHLPIAELFGDGTVSFPGWL